MYLIRCGKSDTTNCYWKLSKLFSIHVSNFHSRCLEMLMVVVALKVMIFLILVVVLKSRKYKHWFIFS